MTGRTDALLRLARWVAIVVALGATFMAADVFSLGFNEEGRHFDGEVVRPDGARIGYALLALAGWGLVGGLTVLQRARHRLRHRRGRTVGRH